VALTGAARSDTALGAQALRVAAAVLLLLTGALAHGDGHDAAGAQRARVERLYERCVDDMAKSVCSAMNDRTQKQTPAPGTQVFVAGVGAIDAASYARIRESGKTMCQQVRRACENDFHGAQCTTAVSLWGAPR